ncbi:MAG: hypothetical protein GX117_12630 [Candidatus Hydrogenedentes bacterium]|nr:hypothetical protein [Candidatus Hydrogenedentota bacterium]
MNCAPSLSVHVLFRSVVLFACLVVAPVFSASWAQSAAPIPLNGCTVESYYAFPASAAAVLISFDWDHTGALHYTVGDGAWGTKLEVYRVAEGEAPFRVFDSQDIWAGSVMSCIDGYVYFNDGGDALRADANYYYYPIEAPQSVAPLLEAPYGASLWGATARHSGEFFASGSAVTWGPAALFYSTVNASGQLETLPPLQFGDLDDSPGPMVFDTEGNLYYAPGYSYGESAFLFRWSVAELEAALADPMLEGLEGDGHGFAAIPQPYAGATGLAVDLDANLYVTATAWDAPSQLLLFPKGQSSPLVLAEYEGRLEAVRFKDNAIYFSCADGIFKLPLLSVESALDSPEVTAEQGKIALFLIESHGGVGALQYQWYRKEGEETFLLAEETQPHLIMTAAWELSGAQFYCVVSDQVSSVVSPTFTLTVQPQLPLSGLFMKGIILCLLIGCGIIILSTPLLRQCIPARNGGDKNL